MFGQDYIMCCPWNRDPLFCNSEMLLEHLLLFFSKTLRNLAMMRISDNKKIVDVLDKLGYLKCILFASRLLRKINQMSSTFSYKGFFDNSTTHLSLMT